jgi:hypothetical protein
MEDSSSSSCEEADFIPNCFVREIGLGKLKSSVAKVLEQSMHNREPIKDLFPTSILAGDVSKFIWFLVIDEIGTLIFATALVPESPNYFQLHVVYVSQFFIENRTLVPQLLNRVVERALQKRRSFYFYLFESESKQTRRYFKKACGSV